MRHSRFSLVLTSTFALVTAASLLAAVAQAQQAKAEEEEEEEEEVSPQAAATFLRNLLQEPMLDDSRVVTVEEERALMLSTRSSAAGAAPDLRVNGAPVLTASPPLVIHAAAFTSDGYDPDSAFFPFSGGYFRGNSANDGCLVAQADLPSGVTLTEMFVSVWDDDALRDVRVDLRRVDNFNGSTINMASGSSSGSVAGVQVLNDNTVNNPVILYPNYSYYVTTCLGSEAIRLFSVRLYWSLP